VSWAQWISIIALWWCIFLNLRIMRRRTHLLREMEREHEITVGEITGATGLTPLQVQVAMDASLAIFQQRIEEMRRSNHGNPD
jgi:hypothetical protein